MNEWMSAYAHSYGLMWTHKEGAILWSIIFIMIFTRVNPWMYAYV